jgi:large subunit ribosomal protein L21
MYAVIETGGKQYRVELGTELEVEQLDVEPGASVTLDRVLLVADGDATAIGRPLVEGAVVDAEVVRQDRADKLIVFKYRPKARRRVKKGHRQPLTVLRITDLRVGGRSAAETARKAERDAKTERQRVEEAAARQAAEDAALAARLADRSKADEAGQESKPKTSRGRAGARSKAVKADTDAGAASDAAAGPKRGRARAGEQADATAAETPADESKPRRTRKSNQSEKSE